MSESVKLSGSNHYILEVFWKNDPAGERTVYDEFKHVAALLYKTVSLEKEPGQIDKIKLYYLDQDNKTRIGITRSFYMLRRLVHQVDTQNKTAANSNSPTPDELYAIYSLVDMRPDIPWKDLQSNESA